MTHIPDVDVCLGRDEQLQAVHHAGVGQLFAQLSRQEGARVLLARHMPPLRELMRTLTLLDRDS